MISQHSKNGYKNVANASMVRGFLPHQSTHYRSFCRPRNCLSKLVAYWNCLSKLVAYWLHTRTTFTQRELDVPRRSGCAFKDARDSAWILMIDKSHVLLAKHYFSLHLEAKMCLRNKAHLHHVRLLFDFALYTETIISNIPCGLSGLCSVF